MKYKNLLFKKIKNAYPLEVACGHCKNPVVMYEKAGKGNLIKMQMPRIIESEMNLEGHQGNLVCPFCQEDLARKGKYRDNTSYWIIRGKVNTKRLDNYFMP